ncbi:hypothetical protein QFZ38_003590 [Pseudomonas cedrina]|nr:hypothetical protein [Pseudomonas cedrina]
MSRADWIKLMIAAARFPLRSDPAKSQFLRPNAHGRMYQASKAALKSLYKDRWHVELDLRILKTTLGLETLSCKTPDMAVKELWVYLLAHNLIRNGNGPISTISRLFTATAELQT